MNITVTSERANALLGRKELAGTVEFDKATPATADFQNELAKHAKAAPETVAVKHLYTEYGARRARFAAFVYASKEQLAKVEPKKKEKKAAPAEAQ